MSQTCKACGHAEREALDQALIEKEPYRHIAARFGRVNRYAATPSTSREKGPRKSV